MEEHTCEARLPHINGNVVSKLDMSGDESAVPVAPHVTFTVLFGNPQSCSRFVSRVACTSQLPLAGFVSR